MPFLSACDQRLLVDDRAARDVDQIALLAERDEDTCVDQLSRAGAAGRDDDQEIDLGGERRGAGEVRVGRLGAPVARGVGDRHAERFGALRDRHADPAEADDAHARAADLARKRHRPLGPVAAANVAVGLDQAARDREDESDRQVGDLVVEDVRRVRDGDAALARRGDVDAVVADTEDRDELERRQLRDQLARHLRLAAGGDRADARRDRGEGGGVALVGSVVDAKRALATLPSSAATGAPR